jgi:anti-sigma B factor antagonist
MKWTVIHWQGRLTLEDGVEGLRTRIQQSSGSVLLDLKDVTEVDSSGLAELVRSRSAVMERRGILKLARVPKRLENILRVTRLNRLFQVESTAAWPQLVAA